MLPLAKNDTPTEKCLFTHGPLPAYIDETQPPTKRKPFSSLLAPKWYHSVRRALVPFSRVRSF